MPWLLNPRIGGLGLLALFLALLPLFLPNAYFYEIAIIAGLNAVVCVGLNLLIGYAGQISLGHAGFFALGAYGSVILADRYGIHPALGMVLAAAAVGLLAWVVARPILRLKGHYLAMATLGIGIIISIAINTESWLTGGPDGLITVPLTIGGEPVYSEKTWYGIVAVALLLVVWLSLNLIDSPIGRALRAVHGSEVGAEVVGVDTARYKVLVFVVSAVIASLAGSLFAHYTTLISPGEAGFFHSIEFVTMVVFGGMASTFGAVVGAGILTALPQVLIVLHDYEAIFLGGIMMGTMIFMPRGLVPTLAGVLRRRGRA